MSDGTPTLDTTAPAPPASEPVEIADQAVEQQTEEEAPVVEDDHEEIDYEGEKYRVPKKLKSGFMMQADYTRKTQEVAEQRKGLEGAQNAFKQQAESHQAFLQDVGRVMVLNEQIDKLEKTNWQELEANDPFGASAKFREYTLAKGQRDGLISNIQAAEQKRTQDAQQDFAKRYQQANEVLAREIPGWNEELIGKLRDFAGQHGVTEDDMKAMAIRAPMVKLLHQAFLGSQLIAAKQTAAKEADEPKPEVKPLTKVTGQGAKTTPSLKEASMDDYIAIRRKQGFGKR